MLYLPHVTEFIVLWALSTNEWTHHSNDIQHLTLFIMDTSLTYDTYSKVDVKWTRWSTPYE